MKRKSISISEFEKKEINHATFKRNKMYLDFNKLANDQKDMELRRRSPDIIARSPKSQSVNSKIDNLFRNSIKEMQSKLEEETKRFRERVGNTSPMGFDDGKGMNVGETRYDTQRTSYANPQTDDDSPVSKQALQRMNRTSSNLSYTENELSQNKIKGIPLDKQISRDYLYRYKVQRNNAIDERNFNNFSITKHDLSKTQDFKKLSPRNINFVNEHINDLNYNTQKQYQKFFFSTKPMKTTFRLSLQNNKQGRKFFQPVRAQNTAATDLDPQKIHRSFTTSTNFKPNKISPFYKMSDRNLPHQLDQRNLSPNKNFYKDSNGRLLKQQIDYAVKKMYDDLVRKQKEELYRKKNPEFTRDQICDQRYFKEMIKRENKLLGEM